jgi:hypothetical protein
MNNYHTQSQLLLTFCVLIHVFKIFSQYEEDERFCSHSQAISAAVAEEISHLNNRSATPTAGHKGEEPSDDEDEGVGEEGEHDEEYRRQTEEVDMHCS